MNVHIVCRDYHEDRVLPRLAHSLSSGNGWTLSSEPDEKADLNYFMLYIDYAERHSDWHKTPIAAYFSHYEPNHPYKKFWWQNAMQTVDIRVITCDTVREFLDDRVRTFKATPPVDEQFSSDGYRKNTVPRIGFSGFVNSRYNRKGSDLVARLRQDLPTCDLVASGSGWPVPTKMYRFGELPEFYNSLDVLVCTSSIEGIPMPPLEALACGTPVVIPHGVGMLDELPDVPGIYRYEVGNYNELQDQVRHALAREHSPAPLTSCVSGFTQEQWCQDHLTGFAQPGQQHEKPIVMESDRHGRRGVLYVAYGKPARQCAQAGIESFKQYMPNVEVALVSDSPLGTEDIFIQHADEDIGGRSAKTLIDTLAPSEWQYVMYLDADTEVVAPIDFMFELVEDGFDFVICKNPGKYHTARQMIRSDNRDECEYTFNLIGSDELIQLNGGVFVYQRNVRTKSFFDTWHAEWSRWGKRDQAALLRSLFQHPMKMFVLGNEWNTITRYDRPETSAGILHYPMTARRWRGVLHDRSDSPSAWQAVKRFEREK